jgi:hypothetical protein
MCDRARHRPVRHASARARMDPSPAAEAIPYLLSSVLPRGGFRVLYRPRSRVFAGCSRRPHRRLFPRPLPASPPRPLGGGGARRRHDSVAAPRPATRRSSRDPGRRRSGIPPRCTRGRPRAGAAAVASRDHRSAIAHADDRKPGWGDTRLPVAFARMGITVRSSVQSTAGVPGNMPMSGGRDIHRRPCLLLRPQSPDGTPHAQKSCSLVFSSLASRSRKRARARWETLRYFSLDQPNWPQNWAQLMSESTRLQRISR